MLGKKCSQTFIKSNLHQHCDSKEQYTELINSHQQMHQNKFVTDFFIKRLPQYTEWWENSELLIHYWTKIKRTVFFFMD
jgi:hypothetical protein